MEDAAQKMRQARERLKLRYRDVVDASKLIAEQYQNEEFRIVPSRLAAIESDGILPSLYRLYSLCVIYRLDYGDALEWYGIKLNRLHSDAAQIRHPHTHLSSLKEEAEGDVVVPLSLNPGVDLRRTVFLTQVIQRWGTLPLSALQGFSPKQIRFAWIGLEDYYMYPILRPGALVMIDESKKRAAHEGWTHELERPIYLLEHREGYLCSWCSVQGAQLITQPSLSSGLPPRVFQFPQEVEIIGQVTGVAMTFDSPRPPRTHS